MICAYTHARLFTMTGPAHDSGYLVIEDDKIVAIGAGDLPVAYQSADLIEDCKGLVLMPGLIDAHCHVGLFNDGLGKEGEDGNEASEPVTPQMLATDSIFSEDRCFSEAVAAGVTTVMTGPGSANVISGQFALLHTIGRRVESMTIRRQAALKVALGENPKSVHGAKDRSPATRMATAAIFREALTKALRYQTRLEKAQIAIAAGNPDIELPDLDFKSEALLPALQGAMLVKFHAHRADDILTAVRVATEFGLRYTLDHCTEGYRIADLLAFEYQQGQQPQYGCGIPGQARLEGAIIGPIISDRSKPELSRSEAKNAGVLASAGIPIAIMTDHPVIPIQYLALSAAVACKAGLSEDLALQAITSNAALLAGLADSHGSLAIGKQADVVFYDGHPFDYRTRTIRVLIAGQTAWSEVSS
ncbi:MAG: amidohydrolase family protein [Eubacteriales bacterium]|nr:amidohydrolase family protein [Eubacteriales bacterium]